MNDTIKRHDKPGISPASLVVGAALGAGAAVAANYAMKDEKTKKKVTDAIIKVRDHTRSYVENAASGKTGEKILNKKDAITEDLKEKGAKILSEKSKN
ncbi:MAG: hypothetical protein RLZZ455_886 [Candidatus Parcubacteria bacterium]|jgi:uncharacterized OsmC-like protein